MKAIKVTTGGDISVVELNEPIYKSVVEEIGGFEIVRPKYNKFPEPFVLVIDDDGLRKSLPINMVGTHFYDPDLKNSRGIVGDILIMAEGMTEDGPDFVSIDDTQLVIMLEAMTILYISYKYDDKCQLYEIPGKGMGFATTDPEVAEDILARLEKAREYSGATIEKSCEVPDNVIPLRRRN